MIPDEANDALRLLKDHLATISDVQGIQSLLLWDQQEEMEEHWAFGYFPVYTFGNVLSAQFERTSTATAAGTTRTS